MNLKWLFAKRGMIPRGMAATFEDASRVRDATGSLWIVEYLRARRSDRKMAGYFRKKHFAEKPSLDA